MDFQSLRLILTKPLSRTQRGFLFYGDQNSVRYFLDRDKPISNQGTKKFQASK
jgi:hypothetical protein